VLIVDIGNNQTNMGIFDEIAEKKIEEAIKRNEFDDLEGFGKPLDNRKYFSVPAENRLTFHIMENANVLPEEIQLKKEIINLNTKMREELTTDEKESLLQKRSELLTKLDVFLENYSKR